MAIFNSYVCLPEGKVFLLFQQALRPHTICQCHRWRAMSISIRFTPKHPTTASWVYTKLARRTGNKWLLGAKSEFLTFVLLVSKYVYMGLSENRGYPQIAILMGNMVIIHWNMRYTIFRQTHNIMYTWLVVWNIFFLYIGNNSPNGHSYFSEGQVYHQPVY